MDAFLDRYSFVIIVVCASVILLAFIKSFMMLYRRLKDLINSFLGKI